MTRVTRETVAAVMDNPPDFIERSYLPAWRAGRFSTEALAGGGVAALGHSPYNSAIVDEVTRHLEGLGYTDELIAAVFL